jgi:hypothetical protein
MSNPTDYYSFNDLPDDAMCECTHAKGAHISIGGGPAGCFETGCDCDSFRHDVVDRGAPTGPVYPVARVTWQVPGQAMPQVVETPSCLVIVAPNINEPGSAMSALHVPSDKHSIHLVAIALAMLRRDYGAVAVRQAIAGEATGAITVQSNGLNPVQWDQPERPDGPRGDDPFGGPIGGGRLG